MTSRTPKCRICSYQQPKGRESVPIYHRHGSTRQARVLQGAEYATKNCTYMCPSCQVPHMAAMDYGLDICVSDSTLHEIHHPREPGVICPPDSSHVDWLTIPGATVEELLFAWQVEYGHEKRPMRILLVGGLNNLIKGGDFESLTTQYKRFGHNVSYQGSFQHPGRTSSFAVAPLLPAPKLVWFPDNGATSPSYRNRRDEVTRINEWVKTFNMKNGIHQVPAFNTLGTRTCKKKMEGGKLVDFKTHRWNLWRASEGREDKLHLVDKERVRMGQYVLKYFQGERRDKGPLV